MSVFYDSDPGRLEVYRPRVDGLTSRSFCVSVLLHALVACLLLTVHFPKPQSTPRRRYRITEVTLLPRRPVAATEERPEKVAETLSPQDLSLFLNDLAPARSRRHRGRSASAARPSATSTRTGCSTWS